MIDTKKDKRLVRIIDKTRIYKKETKDIYKKEEYLHIIDRVDLASQVSHSKFGRGRVKSISGGIIEISFKTSTRKFSFPEAFIENYLYLEDQED